MANSAYEYVRRYESKHSCSYAKSPDNLKLNSLRLVQRLVEKIHDDVTAIFCNRNAALASASLVTDVIQLERLVL